MSRIKLPYLLAKRLLPPAIKRSLFVIYKTLLKSWSTHCMGRPRTSGLMAHLVVLVVKLRTNLSYRCLERLTDMAHATLARMVVRACLALSNLALARLDKFAVVDTTTIRLGRGAGVSDYTGHKHIRGIKVQIMVDLRMQIGSVKGPYPAPWHDKRIFECAATTLRPLPKTILGDKAYLGLSAYGVAVPEKRNHRQYKKNPQATKVENTMLNRYRIVVEHTFASIKRNKVFYTGFHFTRERLFQFFFCACIMHNAELTLRSQ